MTFEAAQANDTMQFVQTINSNDDIDRAGRWKRKVKRFASATGDQLDSSVFLHNVVGNITSEDTNESDESEVLFYDSDPEYTRERSLRRGPRRAIAERENALKGANRKRGTLSGVPMNRLNIGRRWKKMDDDLITEIIEVSFLVIYRLFFYQCFICSQ
jgi:hypothetical protein